MSAEVDGVLADDDQLAPSRLRMRRKLFDTLLIGAPEDERLRELVKLLSLVQWQALNVADA